MNLILLTIDCLRADHLSCLGYPKKTTPNLDYLASSGLLFSQAISAGSKTANSFIGIFTSTYSLMHGGQLYITNSRTTIAQVLKEHGYRTAAFHSNPGLSYYGYHKGFDTTGYSIGKGHVESLPTKAKELAIARRNSKLYKTLARIYRTIMFLPYVKAEALNKKAISWLQYNQNDFFLWMHYMDVHQPYVLHHQRIVSPFERRRLIKLNEKAQGTRRGQDNLSPDEVKELINLYDAEISYVDEMIASLFRVLKRSGILDNTFVIVTADHGQQFMEHGHYGHGDDLYDELIHVPLIIIGPGLEPKVISQQVSHLDLAPTILHILNIEKPEAFLGNSLLPLVNRNRAEAGNSEAISETDYEPLRYFVKKPRVNKREISLRTGKWKYIYIEDKQDELYCLEDDPKETQNIIDVQPEMATELRAKIMAHIEFEDKSTPSEQELIKEKVSELKGSGKI